MTLIKKIGGFIVIAVYLLASLSFVSAKRKEVVCKTIRVDVLDSIQNGFVSDDDIISILDRDALNILGYPVISINTNELEELVEKYPPVKKVEVYTKMDGTLNIAIRQREPILRIITNDEKSFYVDYEGAIMPMSHRYTSHVIVANGNIFQRVKIENSRFITDTNSVEVTRGKRNVMLELYELAKIIFEDPFLDAQIVQIYVNKKQEFELIPRVGAHIIYFGDISDARYKFKKLKTFYLRGLNNIGWNQYDKINVKYSNQVICTKR